MARSSRVAEIYNAALADQRNGKIDEAIAGYRRTLTLDPDMVSAYSNLGVLLMQQRHLAEAKTLFETALQHNPNDHEVLTNLGLLLRMKGDMRGALDCYRKAIDAKPDFHPALGNLGATLDDMGKTDEALVCYRRALQIKPDFAEAHNNIGVVMKRKGKFAEAKACYEKALECNPNYAEACSNLGAILRGWGKFDDMLPLYRKAVECKPSAVDLHSNLLFTLNCIPDTIPEDVAAEHRTWASAHGSPKSAQTAHANDPDPERRLRIGYISPDIRDHSVAFFLEPILAAHKADNVELIAYAEVKDPDTVTKRLKQYFSLWRNTVGMSDEALIKQITEDRVDILVDLAGHTAHNRLRAMSFKPAPVQVTYLGYPNTTGMSAVDYRLTDALCDPAEHQNINVEELVRLPTGFLCYAPSVDAPEVGPLPAKTKGHFTFGSFNAAHKINTRTIAIWADILRALPTSKLLLKSATFSDETTREYYLTYFEQHKIERGRVQVLAWEQSRGNHYGIYNEIDLALDPFPYNGTTTTCEGMWMGVPTLTLTGNTHVSRVGTSLLHRVGLDELIAASPQEYIAKAVALANNLDHLEKIRAGLRKRMDQSPLCDAENFTAALEGAYRAMWKRWSARQRGEADLGTVDTQLTQNPPARVARAERNYQVRGEAPTSTQDGTMELVTGTTKKGRMKAIGRLAETAILADAMAKLGQHEIAVQYARQGLAYVRRSQYQGGIPQTLLDSWQAPTPEGVLLRQCLAFSNHSSFLARQKSQEWLMAWAKLEPENPEPFLRFGLLFALVASEAGLPVPQAALDALKHAQQRQRDERPMLALALLSGPLKEFCAPYDGTAIFLRPDIRALSTYVLLEQGDWFEAELDLLRVLVQPGDCMLDLGCNIGVYALSAAQRVGDTGRVIAIEENKETFRLLEKSAILSPRVRALNVACTADMKLDALLCEEKINALDFVKVSFETRKILLGENARSILDGAPILIYELRDGENPDLNFEAELRARGFDSYVYLAGQRALTLFTENTDLDDSVINLVAMRPDSLGRLGGSIRLV